MALKLITDWLMISPWGVIMETLGDGYPSRTAHLIETFDPNFTSVGPCITITGGTENVKIQHHDALLIIHKLYTHRANSSKHV